MHTKPLQIRFETPEALRAEFVKNISNQGIFVATDRELEVRATIEVEVILSYVTDQAAALTLEGEIVHRIPPEMVASGAEPGVAIQFESSTAELREQFEPLLGQAALAQAEVDPVEPQRRGARRGSVRVPVRVMPTMSPPFEATSRDLSATGILLSMRDDPLPIGEILRVCLWHPTGESSIELDGKVVREVKNKSGRIAAVAIAFDRNQAADPRTKDLIEALRHAGHRSRLGGISGSLSDLGLANMLQMFGSSAPQGTLVVECDGEQGWVAFAKEQFLGAELGNLRGVDALVAMLDWGDGRFEFEASADAALIESAEPQPLAGVVFEAVCALDERDRETTTVEHADPPFVVAGSMTFVVDPDLEQQSGSRLEKTAQAVVDLAKAGMTVERMVAIIPEAESSIQESIAGLVESGLLIPR